MHKSLVDWEQKNDELTKDMEEYTENYVCKKCPNDDPGKWCEHLLAARTRKFRKRILQNLEGLSMISD